MANKISCYRTGARNQIKRLPQYLFPFGIKIAPQSDLYRFVPVRDQNRYSLDMRAQTYEEIGSIVRTERKAQGLRQEELALAAGTGRRFVSELESGKPTVQLRAVLQVLRALGLELEIQRRASK